MSLLITIAVTIVLCLLARKAGMYDGGWPK
jgi:hypothetical protein